MPGPAPVAAIEELDVEKEPPAGPDMLRREPELVLAFIALRVRPEPKDAMRFDSFECNGFGGGLKLGSIGDIRDGDIGPRSSRSRFSAAAQSFQGSVWDSPMWPQPLC